MFDLATVLAGIAEFEGDRISKRSKSNRLAPKVLALVAKKLSYLWIARDLEISKNTVAAIVHRKI